MAITGIGNNYSNNVYESTYAAQINEAAKKSETKEASAQAEVTANIENGKVSDYYSYLQKNYDCLSKGNVTISGEYLEKCAGNSAKAKELEDFLKKIPELEKQGYEELAARNKALGGTVTCYQQTWMINKDGSIQSTVYSVTETGMTNAERMKKSMDERLEKQKEKKEEEKIEEQKEARQAAFDKEVVQLDKKANYLPEYSGMYGADKAVATAVENCSKEEQAFVYDIIRQNFLIGNSSSMTEEERQANISLGMKKAEYAAENFISEDNKSAFLDAMESIAKLAAAGSSDASGNMDYGVKKGNYLGHGSNLVYTTDGLDMMRTMDSSAYAEYQKISKESSNADRPLNTLKYLTNWYADAVKKNPGMVDKYEEQSDKYVEEKVKAQKLDNTFAGIKTDSKSAFLENLRAFQISNPNFLSSILKKELALDLNGVAGKRISH